MQLIQEHRRPYYPTSASRNLTNHTLDHRWKSILKVLRNVEQELLLWVIECDFRGHL